MNKNQLKAIQIALKVLSSIKIKPGLKESTVAAQIKALLKKYNAKPAFKIIVGSGRRSAIPHCFAANKRIKKGLNKFSILEIQRSKTDVSSTLIRKNIKNSIKKKIEKIFLR